MRAAAGRERTDERDDAVAEAISPSTGRLTDLLDPTEGWSEDRMNRKIQRYRVC
jgi:hypothetical protein